MVKTQDMEGIKALPIQPPLAKLLRGLPLSWGLPAGRERAGTQQVTPWVTTGGEGLEIQAMGGHHSAQHWPLANEGTIRKKEGWPRGREGLRAPCSQGLLPDSVP